MKKVKFLSLAAGAVLTASALVPTTTAFAANTSLLEGQEYQSNGVLEVDFVKDVDLSNAKVSVKDSNGKAYTVTLYGNKKNDDDLKIKIQKFVAGKTYKYTISNIVLANGTTESVSGTVKIPLNKASIQKTTYEGSGKVEVDFRYDVDFRHNVKVTVKDNTGATYATKILDWDDDELEFRILNYKAGRTYTYTIVGVRPDGTTAYNRISGKVTIPDKSNNISLAKAKQIAEAKIKAAGFDPAGMRITKQELDKEDHVYELEYVHERTGAEFEFEIHAKTGKILEWDVDYN